MNVAESFFAGDRRALARALTWVESGLPEGEALLKRARGRGRARVVGLTGSPGSGKSTLADRLIGAVRERGQTVAVLAVDPSSPFTGGAILGDRIRMMRHHKDEGVFIRSMASRGSLGGLAGATVGALALLEAFGFDWIFVETVGVGQSEVDIARVADTTVLVLTPAAGDAVQAFKAGVMEIADLIVVNKFDLPGGDRVVQELRATLEFAPPRPAGWQVPVLTTIAATGQGTAELLQAIEEHHRHLEEHGLLEPHRLERARFEIASVIQALGLESARGGDELVRAVAAGELTPRQAAARLVARVLDLPGEGRQGRA